MATRPLVAVTLLLAVLGALNSAYGVGRAQDDELTPLQAINQVLDDRERSLVSGDKNTWMATIGAGANDEFRRQQARQFDGLRRLPIEGFELEARTLETGDLHAASDRLLPETRMTYRLAGYDDRDVIDTLWMTFRLIDGEWKVWSDTDVSDLGLDTWRNIWDTGEIASISTEHFLVIHHPTHAGRAQALAGLAEEAAGKLAGLWDRPWSGRLPLILPSSIGELETLLQSTVDLDKFVAFVAFNVNRDDGWTPTAPRLYVQDENLRGYGRAFQVETLLHELAHAAGSALAGPFVPGWMHEGVADWLATGRSLTERKPPGGDRALPRDYEFTTGPQETILRAYRESRSAISHLAARQGRGAPLAFFAAAGEQKVAPGSIDFRVDEALRRSTGLSLTDLEGSWSR